MASSRRKRIIIMGAAGRDFHNFNVVYRNSSEYEVVAFTAAQIPNIENRTYPPKLAGEHYPSGIPIYPEERLKDLIEELSADEVVLAYSDLLCSDIIKKASIALAAGADFKILGVRKTMLASRVPIIAVTASRTGAGKSTVTRKLARILKGYGVRTVIVRHPMVYGRLEDSAVYRFEKLEDLDRQCYTIEEREEFEQHVREGNVVYAGIDYRRVLEAAEREAEVILWDGGNNDWPFYRPDLHITVLDPLRPGHETSSFPGMVNLLLADVVVVNKVNVAPKQNVDIVLENVRRYNSRARIILAKSVVTVDRPELVKGKRVLVVEDGPTVMHGYLSYAAGYVAAEKYGAKEIIDPREYAVGSLRDLYEEYPHIGRVLPAAGYGRAQMDDLRETINRSSADVVILGTPTDISRYLGINKPVVRTYYELVEVGGTTLKDVVGEFLSRKASRKAASY